MKKNIVCVVIILLMLLTMVACGSTTQEEVDAQTNQVDQVGTDGVSPEDSETISIQSSDTDSEVEIEPDNESDQNQDSEETPVSTLDGAVIPMDDLAKMLEKRLKEDLVGSTIQVVAVENELSIVFSIDDINCSMAVMAYTFSDSLDDWKDATDIVEYVYDSARAYCKGARMETVPINVIWASEDDINEFYYMISNGDVTFDCVEIYNSVSESHITKEKYDRIADGMKYSEVVDLIGSEGVLSAESSVASITIKIYTWTAEDGIGTASISFQNDIVVAKSQAGLE